jgi:hypothetical protein
MYEVEGQLGRGSTGVVELARAPDGTRVALKRLALHGSVEELARARARIRREAEVLGRLDHRAIVELLDVVDDGDDLVLVMPWLQGGSLADRVRADGPLEAGEVEHLADHLLAALAAAHRAGVVHRDVKPANVLFDADSRPLLADFGVASAREVTAGLTEAGGALGTPGFLSPEQARGEPAGPGADVFSLGATLRWALTGAGPYGKATAGRDVLLWRAARGKVDRCPRSVPAPLRRRIDAMLDPRPARRPTAAALAGGPDGTDEAVPAATRPRRWIVAAALLAGFLLLAPIVITATSGRGRSAGAVATTTTTTGAATAPCTPRRYQPCGADPAPGTNGTRCVDLRADYDGDEDNGCEALPDQLDGTRLDDRVRPTIVPAGDVDEFEVVVDDGPQVLCDGEVRFTLTAPDGITLHLEVLAADGRSLGEVTSAAGVAAPLVVGEPDCGGDDGQTLTARVEAVGSDRTAAPYLLERSGNW